MHSNILTLIITLAGLTMSAGLCGQPLRTDYVNPMAGTKSMGHTFPGACVPFGMVQLSPDTEAVPHNVDGVYQPAAYRYCAGYQYDDSTIIGFSHTHFNGTGHSDLGDILLMPTVGRVQLEQGTAAAPESGYRSRFGHDTETARPGYYSVLLSDYGIRAELTATERCGVHRYTFPEGEGHVILDLAYGIYNYEGKVLMANLRVENDSTLTGYRITRGWSRMNYTHFAIRFSKPIKNYGCRNDETVRYRGFWRKFDMENNFPEMFGTRLTAFFDFDFAGGEALEVRVALSAVDAAGALNNLRVETEGKSFDGLCTAARDKWERELGVIDIKADDERRAVFYTALYRTMIHPSLYQDADGRYRGIDHNIHTAAAGRTNYSVFSVWDTFRAEHPLMNVIKRGRSRQFAASMLDHYRQSVHRALPVWSHAGNENWCMVGYHSVSVLSDAAAKGIEIDRELALQACLHSANLHYYDGIGDYVRLGYVPADGSEVSASATLEYAYDDWAIAALAARMQRPDVAAEYTRRAQSYRQVFDPRIGFARPKDARGAFKTPFDPMDTHGQGFIEGNAWNYSFFVPHDVPGLTALMGGEERFVARLDSLFALHLPAKYFARTEDINEEGLMGSYVHGNEPGHHIPYLYAWTSQPWKGQARVRAIMDRMYKNKADGLCGNDDCGQMSAWYVFSAMGFYPVCPGSDRYVLGSPNAEEITVHLENGNTLRIKARHFSDRNVYVRSLTINGQPHRSPFISHSTLMQGGEWVFEMGDRAGENY